ncbi:MAG TPA: asparaginase domain-containing protein [Candidatus Limnocylindrales bacterium]|nr:asparaginase domain-containing protein [Candidatus Limnocylindrales bacterium]
MILGERSDIEHQATGGTVDMIWSPERDGVTTVSYSASANLFGFLAAELGFPLINSQVLMQKDSREIDDQDLDRIVNHVAESGAKRTIVTSGTYAMDGIGKEIASHPNLVTNTQRRAIAMVSSIIPLTGFEQSDGGFNLGMATAVLQHVDPTKVPVFGVASGIAAPIDKMRKSLHNATFRVDAGINMLGYRNYSLVPAGGTIDFVSNGLDGVEPARKSLIPDYIRDNVRSTVSFHATPPILKDSRYLTKEDRDLIVDLIRQDTTGFVVVTSGLLKVGLLRDRLNEALRQSVDDHDKNRRVVITGSRFLLAMSGVRSDAAFNLGYAHGMLGNIEPGRAHIAVTGRVIGEHEDPLAYCYSVEELQKIGYDTSVEE